MTAIQFLISQMLECAGNHEDDTMQIIIPRESFIKATEMEKQQILDAHIDASELGGFEASAEDWANRYYNETYKNK
jgi:hypothetical protein